MGSGGWEVDPPERGLLLYNGGTVCDDAFDDDSAAAICNEMGLGGSFFLTIQVYSHHPIYRVDRGKLFVHGISDDAFGL